MLKFFQKPKRLLADTDTLSERYGAFSAAPFERGFGSTVGTALRRVLLSSIEGAAITAVRIEGVDHEFSPIPGVVEDATDIILNLKQVPFKMSTDAVKTIRVVADQAVDGQRQFVGGGLRLGANPPLLHDLCVLLGTGQQPDDGVGVADVDRKQHGYRTPIRGSSSSAASAGTKAGS